VLPHVAAAYRSLKGARMTLRQRQYRSPLSHLTLVLNRLRHEQINGTSKKSSFPELCAMTAIPYDLRQQLLQTLLAEGYVTDVGKGQIRLTPLGMQAAA
jgi:hypothetical protein